MNRRTANMFAATSEDLPLFSGATVAADTAEFNPPVIEEVVKPLPMFEDAPEYDEDGLNGYYLGCSIYIVPVEMWTVGPLLRYRITVKQGMHVYVDYTDDGLTFAHGKAEHIAKYFNYYNPALQAEKLAELTT